MCKHIGVVFDEPEEIVRPNIAMNEEPDHK